GGIRERKEQQDDLFLADQRAKIHFILGLGGQLELDSVISLFDGHSVAPQLCGKGPSARQDRSWAARPPARSSFRRIHSQRRRRLMNGSWRDGVSGAGL